MSASAYDHQAAEVLAGYDDTFDQIGRHAVDQWFHEDAFYWWPGNHKLSGWHRGREGVKKFYETLESFGEVVSDSLILMAAQGWVTNVRTLTGRRPDGTELDTVIVGIYEVVDGKIKSGRHMPTEPEKMENFFT